jgi:hypothetical protein
MDLTRLTDYNLWANDLTRDKLSTLIEEELSRDVLLPYGSIKNLVKHIIVAIEYNKINRV